MHDDLDRLIEAVEAGTATGLMVSRVFDTPCQDMALQEIKPTVWLAYKGDMNAVKALHEALLPGYGWGAGPWGARVWLYSDHPGWDGSVRQEVEMVDAPARAWLLAILRAYRASGTTSQEAKP